MFQRLKKPLLCLFLLLSLLHQSLSIPQISYWHGTVAKNITTDVTFVTFVELVSTGLHKVQVLFPSAQIFLVDARPSYSTPSRNPFDFGRIELRLDDGEPREITTKTIMSAAGPIWTQPERGHRSPRTYIKRFNWEDVRLGLGAAFDIAQASASRGPWADVKILQYAVDAFYPPGQIYYRLTEPGLIDNFLVGLTTLRVYREPHQVDPEDAHGTNKA